MARPFVPLPSDFNLSDRNGVKQLNDALRRLADQIPAAAATPTPPQTVQPDAPELLIAMGTGTLNLISVYLPVTGATITLPHTGRYLINAVFDFSLIASGSGVSIFGQVVIDGAMQAPIALLTSGVTTANVRATVALPPVPYTASAAGKIVSLQAKQNLAGPGPSVCVPTNTCVSAVWLGP